MDLLAGYGSGSDASDDDGNPTENGKVTLINNSPPQQEVSALPSGKSPHSAGSNRLCIVSICGFPGGVQEAPSASTADVGKALSQLPAPGTSAARKRPVQFRLPLNFNPPPDSDSEDEAPSKKLKTSGGARLRDYLPAPKNAVLGAGASARRAAGISVGGSSQVGPAPARPPGAGALAPDPDLAYHQDNEAYRVEDAYPDPGSSHGGSAQAAPLPSGFFDDGQAQPPGGPAVGGPTYEMQYGYPGGGTAGQVTAGQYGGEQYHATEAYYEQGHAYASGGPGVPAGGSAGPGMSEGDRILEAALLAEAEKMKRQKAKDPLKGLGVNFVEVQQEKLTYMNPAQREAMNASRTVLGAGYEAQLRQEAGPMPDKLARRKHQISSLYHQAKMKELDAMDQRARSLKTKAETQAKYGW